MIASKSKWWQCLIWSLAILTLGAPSMGSSPLPSRGQGEDPSVPEIKLRIEGVGNGYSSPALTDKLIYITGEKDSLGYIMAFDWEGKEIWRDCYGPEWTLSFRGSRAEPVVDQTRVYVCSGHGALTCYDAASGKQLWNIDLINELGGQNVNYGYSMPVLIDGDQLFCAPGGKENNIVALDKYSGDILWSSPGVGESAGYGKPLVVNRGDLKILMTFSEFTFLGLDARTGAILWTFDLNFKGELPCNQPVYSEGVIYIVAGPGNGAFAFDLSGDGKSIRERWRNLQFNSFFGGFVLVEDYLVGSAESKRSYVSVDTNKGTIKSQLRFGKGATIIANDLLITYNQQGRCGIMSIIDGKLRLLQDFKISEGTGEHFAIPVYFKDMLIIRHGNTLLGYRI
jgi:outer membrane protein assembly factor BamB